MKTYGILAFVINKAERFIFFLNLFTHTILLWRLILDLKYKMPFVITMLALRNNSGSLIVCWHRKAVNHPAVMESKPCIRDWAKERNMSNKTEGNKYRLPGRVNLYKSIKAWVIHIICWRTCISYNNTLIIQQQLHVYTCTYTHKHKIN